MPRAAAAAAAAAASAGNETNPLPTAGLPVSLSTLLTPDASGKVLVLQLHHLPGARHLFRPQ